MKKLKKKSILKKTAQIGFLTIFSKFLGIIREILQVKYLSVGPLSDAFVMAYQIPNFLRKIFAEGALSASFIPALVKLVKEKKHKIYNQLITTLLVSIGLTVLLICFVVILFPKFTLSIFATGFLEKKIELEYAIKLLKILIFFILFISLSTILSGAMNAKNHFITPALGPILLNFVYISGLFISIYFGFPVEKFALFVLLAPILQLLFFFYKFEKLNFRLSMPDLSIIPHFTQIIIFRFLPSIISVGVLEINYIIDSRFASQLPAGTVTLIKLAFRFMNIALGAFTVGFSSILLSHFSHITTYAPKRLGFYLLEASKLIFWVITPISLLLTFFSFEIFYTIFFKLTHNISLEQVKESSLILIAFTSGLFFYSLNRLLLSIFYSMHYTFLPTIISIVSATSNFLLNWLLIKKFGGTGLAIATAISAAMQLPISLWLLHKKLNVRIYFNKFLIFLVKYIIQLSFVSSLFYISYYSIVYFIKNFLGKYQDFFINNVGLWLWIGPLTILMFGLLYIIRKSFNNKIYFLD